MSKKLKRITVKPCRVCGSTDVFPRYKVCKNCHERIAKAYAAAKERRYSNCRQSIPDQRDCLICGQPFIQKKEWQKRPYCRECTRILLLKEFCYLVESTVQDKPCLYCKKNPRCGKYYCESCLREQRYLKEYSVSSLDVQEMLRLQGYCCAICGKHQDFCKTHKKKVEGDGGCRLCVDHCHKTGKVRGLVCVNCNGMLGFANDSSETLSSAIRYLSFYCAINEGSC